MGYRQSGVTCNIISHVNFAIGCENQTPPRFLFSISGKQRSCMPLVRCPKLRSVGDFSLKLLLVNIGHHKPLLNYIGTNNEAFCGVEMPPLFINKVSTLSDLLEVYLIGLEIYLRFREAVKIVFVLQSWYKGHW